MSQLNNRLALGSVFGFLVFNSAAFAGSAGAGGLELEILNAGPMPISPAAVYSVSNSRINPVAVGSLATPGLIPLCQMGNPDGLIAELQAIPGVTAVKLGAAPTLPGSRLTLQLDPRQLYGKTLRVVAMYGKSRDVCANIEIRADDVKKVITGQLDEATGTDRAVTTGAFTPATVDPQLQCGNAASAVECLRNFSVARAQAEPISYFPGYLPNVLSTVTDHFGAQEAQSLQIAPSGTVQYRLHRLSR